MRTTKPIKVESGVPIPTSNEHLWGPVRKAVNRMKIGESFLVETLAQVNNALVSASDAGVTITTRKENGCGYRIWKVSNQPAKRGAGKPPNHTGERGRK